MPIFKVCLLERTKKIMVKANSLDELKIVALNKFGLSMQVPEEVSVALEEDGTEIDDNEVLLELSSSIQTYIILLQGQVWSAPSAGKIWC